MDNPVTFWRGHLEQYLVKAKMDTDSVSTILRRYDISVSNPNNKPDQVFCQLGEAYASFNTETVHQSLQRQLTELSSKTTIDANPVTRIRRKIAEFNKKVGALDCTIALSDTERQNMAQHQLDGLRSPEQLKAMVKLECPEVFKDKVAEYTSKANHKGKVVDFGVKITY